MAVKLKPEQYDKLIEWWMKIYDVNQIKNAKPEYTPLAFRWLFHRLSQERWVTNWVDLGPKNAKLNHRGFLENYAIYASNVGNFAEHCSTLKQVEDAIKVHPDIGETRLVAAEVARRIAPLSEQDKFLLLAKYPKPKDFLG